MKQRSGYHGSELMKAWMAWDGNETRKPFHGSKPMKKVWREKETQQGNCSLYGSTLIKAWFARERHATRKLILWFEANESMTKTRTNETRKLFSWFEANESMARMRKLWNMYIVLLVRGWWKHDQNEKTMGHGSCSHGSRLMKAWLEEERNGTRKLFSWLEAYEMTTKMRKKWNKEVVVMVRG